MRNFINPTIELEVFIKWPWSTRCIPKNL